MSEPVPNRWTQRVYGVASPALPVPVEQPSWRAAARLAALLPHGRLMVRHGRTGAGIKGTGVQWGQWADVPDVGPEPADTTAPPGRRHAARGGHNAGGLTRARRELGYTYPIDRPPGDTRLSRALVNDLADVLENHGYPPVQSGRDLVGLAAALDKYLYRRDA